MSDGLTQGRINKYLKSIGEAGLTAPDTSGAVDLRGQEAILKEFWNANKPPPGPKPKKEIAPKAPTAAPSGPTDLGDTTDAKAIEALKAEMQAELAKMREFMAKQTTAPSSQGGITVEAIEKLLNKQTNGSVTNNEVREGYVPPGDALDKPVVLWTPQQNEYLSFRNEGGMRVFPPNGQPWLKFENRFRWTVRSGDTWKVRAISAYVCYSKSTLDWVKKHHKFNNTVFMDVSKAIETSEHGEWMQQYNRFYAGLMNVSDGRLPSMAAEYGLPTSMEVEPDARRAQIAEAQTQQHFKQIRAAEDNFAREREADKMLTANAPMQH